MRKIFSKVVFVIFFIFIADLQAIDPPQNLRGDIRIEKKSKVTKIVSWFKSQDPKVIGYKLFRNGVMVANIPQSGLAQFVDHGRTQRKQDIYTIFAYDRTGTKSKTLRVVIPLV